MDLYLITGASRDGGDGGFGITALAYLIAALWVLKLVFGKGK